MGSILADYDANMWDSLPVPNLVLPTDRDGFVTRECPSCGCHFKLRLDDSALPEIAGSGSVNNDAQSEAITGHCPLCHDLVVRGNWRTETQRQYVRSQGMNAAMLAYSDAFLVACKGSRALIELAGFPRVFLSAAPPEADEMCLVVLPCHESWPLKVPADWSGDISCFRCGACFPNGP